MVKGGNMRFLVTTKANQPLPPEMAIGLVDAMSAWAKKYTANGKFEQVWGFAGARGGGGILKVDSLEEVDAIMTEFPFGQFSDIKVSGLVDIDTTLKNIKQVIQAMAPPGS
jgi:muconolactone delta-isomerase